MRKLKKIIHFFFFLLCLQVLSACPGDDSEPESQEPSSEEQPQDEPGEDSSGPLDLAPDDDDSGGDDSDDDSSDDDSSDDDSSNDNSSNDNSSNDDSSDDDSSDDDSSDDDSSNDNSSSSNVPTEGSNAPENPSGTKAPGSTNRPASVPKSTPAPVKTPSGDGAPSKSISDNTNNSAPQVSDSQAVAEVEQTLQLQYQGGGLVNEGDVQGVLNLPVSGANGVTLRWESTDDAVIDPGTGQVTQPAYGGVDANMTLTAIITKNSDEERKVFDNLIVQVTPISDSQAVAEVEQTLQLQYQGGGLVNEGDVQGVLNLPVTGANGVTLRWESTDDAVIDPGTGQVTQPASGGVDANMTLTAIITKNSDEERKVFDNLIVQVAAIVSPYDAEGRNAAGQYRSAINLFAVAHDDAERANFRMQVFSGPVGRRQCHDLGGGWAAVGDNPQAPVFHAYTLLGSGTLFYAKLSLAFIPNVPDEIREAALKFDINSLDLFFVPQQDISKPMAPPLGALYRPHYWLHPDVPNPIPRGNYASGHVQVAIFGSSIGAGVEHRAEDNYIKVDDFVTKNYSLHDDRVSPNSSRVNFATTPMSFWTLSYFEPEKKMAITLHWILDYPGNMELRRLILGGANSFDALIPLLENTAPFNSPVLIPSLREFLSLVP